MAAPYDAILIVSFGGPEGPDEVVPFLENVLRGRNVPRARLPEVAEHYQHLGGVSPINEQNRQLIAALKAELAQHGPELPVFWGNRNWHPFLEDALREMELAGVRRAIAFVTSAFGSYSGCRQYREDIARARECCGASAPQVDKLRVFFNHPGFVEPMAERTSASLAKLSTDRQANARLVFSAHSIPLGMAEHCGYETQLREACRLVAERVGADQWDLVYQSRSGPPQQRWLEPDIGDFLKCEHAAGRLRTVIIVPIGFISDHMEVLFDLDTEARDICNELGITMIRAGTVGTDPRFVSMIRELIVERMCDEPERLALGELGPSHDVCPEDCCLYSAPRT